MCLVFGTETSTVNNCGRWLEIFWGRDASCGGVVGQRGYFTGHTWGSERGENLFHDSRHFFWHNLWRVGWFLWVVGKFVVGAVGWTIFCMACISALWSDLDTAFTLPKANMESLKSHLFFHRNVLWQSIAVHCCRFTRKARRCKRWGKPFLFAAPITCPSSLESVTNQ